MKALGIDVALLTGDHIRTARHVAAQARIQVVEASCLPEGKLRSVERFEEEGRRVCMVGDGVNDAPALKRAAVGVAMGCVGSDIAVDAADIVLVRDDITEFPHLFTLSRHMMLAVKLNMAFSMALNFAALALALSGVLNPVLGALVHNAGSVLVIANSARLLAWRQGAKGAASRSGPHSAA